MKRLIYLLPLVIAAVLGAFALWGLQDGRDPGAIPSALIGREAPAFELPAVEGTGTPGFSRADLDGQEGLVLVNVFASWCGPCRAEHPVLTRLAEEQGLPLMGLNYKDKADAAAAWLEELGNPYDRIGHDYSGRAGIDWGVTGVPETFILSADGVILYREAGPVVGGGRRRLEAKLAELKDGSS